jgi:hypothetical protein
MLKSFDDFNLMDKNGIYLIPKEEDVNVNE